MAFQDLLDPNDPDWESYQTKDPDWFLRATGAAIRKYCGWHIYPNIQETVRNLHAGTKGIIMLPSRHVTEVNQLFIQDAPPAGGCEPTIIGPGEYIWFEAGWIQRQGWSYWDAEYSGYFYGDEPYYLPVTQPGVAHCTLRHGYPILPDDIKQVAYELTQSTLDMGSGNIKEIASPGYRLQPSQPFGMTLNPDQKGRLANYRIGMTC